ncbi:iron-containing alcohol dehydrogenase family protein [Microbacterium immunditiarum]|nr:iron-containing alcohol dehydrogenase [Microbacterium immunditiarum]
MQGTTEFIAPRVTLAGRGTTAKLGEYLVPRGFTTSSVLVVVDDHLRDNEAYLRLERGLRRAELSPTVIGGLGTEPDDGRIDEAAERARGVDYAYVIGVGGGSVMDAAKMLAVLVRNGGGAADWVGPIEPPGGIAPLAFVPSTCGTGAEVTRAAMVTVGGAKRISVSSRYPGGHVVLDPGILDGLPAAVIASTGLDALAHAAEAMMSKDRSWSTVRNSVSAIESLVANIEAAVRGDRDALEECFYASHAAGLALNAGVQLGHSVAYCIANVVHVPHGIASGLALPYCIAYNSRALDGSSTGKVLSRAVTGGLGDTLSDASASLDGLLSRLSMPRSLSDLGISASVAQGMADTCYGDYPRPANPAPLLLASLRDLFAAMHAGDLQAAFSASPGAGDGA